MVIMIQSKWLLGWKHIETEWLETASEHAQSSYLPFSIASIW